MPKSSSFTWPSPRHQDVARLQVAVHHQVAVRVLAPCGRRREELQPLGDAQRALLAVSVVIGSPSTSSITRYGRPSSVAPPSSSRAMPGWLEPRQDAALGAEAREHVVGIEPAPQHLDGDVLLEVARLALRVVDGAPAAAAQLRDHAVPADAFRHRSARPVLGLRPRGELLQRHVAHGIGPGFQVPAALLLGVEQAVHVRGNRAIASGTVDERGALGLRQLERGIEETGHLEPPFWRLLRARHDRGRDEDRVPYRQPRARARPGDGRTRQDGSGLRMGQRARADGASNGLPGTAR
jgi:hypothetical protein